MHSPWLLPLLAALALAHVCPCLALEYPRARTDAVSDNYHGITVPDPFRWLKDSESVATRAWIEAENKLAASILDTSASRAAFEHRLTQLSNSRAQHSLKTKRSS